MKRALLITAGLTAAAAVFMFGMALLRMKSGWPEAAASDGVIGAVNVVLCAINLGNYFRLRRLGL
jgi:hypothetical protein